MQLKLKFDVATYIPVDSKVRLVCNIVEEMNLDFVLSTYSDKGRKPVVDPVTMLKILLFCYSEGVYSCRKILETFSSDLLTQFVELLMQEGHINLKNIYIDGTKIEVVAGRYTFVWRKSVEKHQKKLKDQIIKELGLPEDSNLEYVTGCAKQVFNNIRNICSSNNIVFVHGIGKRKTPYQHDYQHLKDMLDRLEKYEEHLLIMADRNSYSKTDHDATFM